MKVFKYCLVFYISSLQVRTSLVAQMVKHLSTVRETWVQSLDWEDSLEKEMATHSSTLALKIPWMEELGAGYYPWGCKESGTTERLHFTSNVPLFIPNCAYLHLHSFPTTSFFFLFFNFTILYWFCHIST